MTRASLSVVDWFVALTAGAGGIALVSGAEAMRFPHECCEGAVGAVRGGSLEFFRAAAGGSRPTS